MVRAMSPVAVSREPVSIVVDHQHYHFYCRLFADEDHARTIFRQLVDHAGPSEASVILIREMSRELTWGILAFSPLRLELLTLAPFIADHGEPYYSEFMTEAVIRRKTALANGVGHEGDLPPLSLRNFQPKHLL